MSQSFITLHSHIDRLKDKHYNKILVAVMIEKNMNGYNQFIDKLKIDLKSYLSTPKEIWDEMAAKYVNGLAADELRRLITIETRRQYGAFFTDSLLAKKVLKYLNPSFSSNSFIYDPASGAGNLLIAVSDYIEELHINLNWENHLLGTDIHNEFVEATKLRLITNYLLKHPFSSLSEYKAQNNKHYSIIKADGLIKNEFYEKATHIVVNPPFNQVITDEKLNWSKGKVSAAALFIYKIIQNSNPGVSIAAILPDVLRSGSRYEKWRFMVAKECIIEKTKLLGQFDEYADVDVFAISLTKRQKSITRSVKSARLALKNIDHTKTLEDLFDICVGPVVDNRDEKEGPSHSYIVSRGLKGWSIQKEINLNRKHQGKTFNSPFVVIKRTSRMGDSHRAVATIINVPNPVFVDNHLIILHPKSGALKDCWKALAVLKDSRTDNWLNDKIRCRHLTVKVVLKIPIRE